MPGVAYGRQCSAAAQRTRWSGFGVHGGRESSREGCARAFAEAAWMDESRNREMNCLFGLGESERRAAAFDETLRVRYLTPTMKHQRPAHPPLTAARALACSVRASCSSKQGGAGARTRPQLLYLFAVRFAQERDGESPTRVVIVPDTPHSPCRCG